MSDTLVRPSRASPKLGRYELIELLAQGGMGEVHLARLAGTGGFEKLCIVKTILPSLLKDSQFVERFQHEAKVLVHLSHANIAQVYDMGESDGVTYIALEFVPGVDLASLQEGLRKRGEEMPAPAALYVGQKLADGLGYAHRKLGPDGKPLRIVHRDVSPQNVMLSFEGDLKIIDFGLAKSTAQARQTQTPTVMGKLGYMSPEQARAERVDARSDIYSAGVVVWELLAGRSLIPRGTASEMVAAMMSPRIPPLAPIRADLPVGLEQVLRRALAPDVADRYATADEFSRALAEISLRTTGLLATERMGQFVRATCPEPFESHRRLISRLNTLRSPEPQPPAPTPASPAVPPTTAPLPPRKSGLSVWAVAGIVLGFCVVSCFVLSVGSRVIASRSAPAVLEGRPDAATPSPPPKRAGKFTVRYGSPQNPIVMQWKTDHVLEQLASSLNQQILLPRDIALSLESCGNRDAFFNRADASVHLCTGWVAFLGEKFARTPKFNGPRATRFAALFWLIHDVAHALIQILDLAVGGNEEAAADELATLVFTFASPGDRGGGLYLALALGWTDEGSPAVAAHAHGKDRALNVLCLLYGAHPQSFQVMVDQGTLPKARAQQCLGEYPRVHHRWGKLLEGHLASPWPAL